MQEGLKHLLLPKRVLLVELREAVACLLVLVDERGPVLDGVKGLLGLGRIALRPLRRLPACLLPRRVEVPELPLEPHLVALELGELAAELDLGALEVLLDLEEPLLLLLAGLDLLLERRPLLEQLRHALLEGLLELLALGTLALHVGELLDEVPLGLVLALARNRDLGDKVLLLSHSLRAHALELLETSHALVKLRLHTRELALEP
mmetsp:Transcript_52056/g.127081  ORF Transcript_52056/g.127081 Transcript_52056/m.127081 type:complete len:206 (-) Transcript_52056:1480-2097(-)